MPGFPTGKRWFTIFAPRLPRRALCMVFLCALPSLCAPPASGDTLDLPVSGVRGAASPSLELQESATYRLDAASLRRFATLEDALASLPGFRVRRQGGLGGYSELSFRGARGVAVAVYVDGMRLNQDGDGAPDLSKWPSLWFSSLEARTGFDAAGAGPGTLARIDLSTQPDRPARGADAHARAGSFSVYESAVSLRGDAGVPPLRWVWNAGLEGQTARNDYTYLDGNGTDYNPADDAVRHMENNGYWSRGARAALRRETPASRQSLSALWLDSRKEYPGFTGSGARAYTRRADWLAAWRLENFGAALPWEAGLQGRRFDDSYHDPAQTLGYISFESARVSLSLEADARARIRTAEFSRGNVDWTPQLRLRTESVEPRATPFTQPQRPPSVRRHEAQLGSVFEGVFFREASRSLSASVDVRASALRFLADGARPFPDSGYGRIKTAHRFPVAARVANQWNAGRQSAGWLARFEQRAPSSAEILGDNNGVKGNRDLLAEVTLGASANHSIGSVPEGVSPGAAGAAEWRLRSTVFWNAYHNPIRLGQFGSSAFLRYANAADYGARGIEWTARAAGRRAEGSASLTLQDASIEEGEYKGNRPAHQSGAEAHAEIFWKPFPGARAGSLFDYRGAYDPGDANVPDARRPAEWECGAHASVENGRVRAAFDARNLTDRRYRDFAYSPRSGRNYAFTLSLTL